jgi:hypothetical protein
MTISRLLLSVRSLEPHAAVKSSTLSSGEQLQHVRRLFDDIYGRSCPQFRDHLQEFVVQRARTDMFPATRRR